MLDKRFIFTVTTGRSGTAYLTKIMSLFPHTVSLHEPKPYFANCMRPAQSKPELASEFLVNRKIPEMLRLLGDEDIYVETSHLFCKGFLEAWLELSDMPVPDLVLLDRDLRKVAKSIYQLQTIPGRTQKGLIWYLSPADTGTLVKMPDWQRLNDYQLCYWYCQEIEARKKKYRSMIEQRGGRCAQTSVEALKTAKGLRQLQQTLALPAIGFSGWLSYFSNRNAVINEKSAKKKQALSFTDEQLNEFEREVDQLIG